MVLDYLLAAAVAFAASALACRIAIAAGVEDAAAERHKDHKIPTPTSAGLAIGIGFALGVCALVYPPVRAWNELAGARSAFDLALAMIPAFVFLGIGAWDDLWPLRARTKIGLFVLASFTPPVFSAMRPEEIAFGAGLVLELPIYIAVIGAALWVFTLVNAVNFMDGANGLAMGCVAIGLLFLLAIAVDAERMNTAAVCLCGAAALGGFLIWNFPKGKIFAGDSGALFAGAIAAIASLLAVRNNGVSPFVPVLLFFPLLADTLLTLVWRLWRGRDVLVGHREHIYQIGKSARLGVERVTLYYWAASSACGVIAYLADAAARGGLETPTGNADLDRALGTAFSYIPLVTLAVFAACACIFNARVRAFARRRGLIAE